MQIKHLAGAFILASSILTPAFAAEPAKGPTGKELAFAQAKGNCLACHAIAGGEQPGTLGPALNDMKARYPDKNLLTARIADETAFNPYTPMPPFLKHGTLTQEELTKVVDFIHGL
ncbi:MAG: sulfur oxidation c-type cytochrome SoxX [Betaproteobacteria bacterium]|nr:sulfur oxidation c-type cytochrome SoxX [Betaproteobacteria bacterium]